MTRVAEPFLRAIVGKRVSLAWRGYGSALFLELGKLTPSRKRRRDRSKRHPDGEVTLAIEWSWRIENPRSILGGSWSDERRWPGLFEKLMDAAVTDVRVFGTLPELEVCLSNGRRIVSFMTAEGQPQWYLISRVNPIGTLSVKRGKLHLDRAGG